MARTRRHRKAAGVAAAALLAAIAAQPATGAKPGLADRLGEWGGTWSNNVRNEIRIDEATPKAVTGTFCDVRKGDGSVFFYDFDKVESKVMADSVELKRGKHTHWVSATGDGVKLGYRRKNKKRFEMNLDQGAMQCVVRITPATAPIDAHDEQADTAGMVGTWSAYDDKGKATEVRIAEHSAQGTSGTVCFVLKNDSAAFFDFAPGGRIEASTEGERVTVERKPFKGKMTHVMEMTGKGQVTYTERVGNKPPRLTLKLNRGAVDDGCLRRIRPARI